MVWAAFWVGGATDIVFITHRMNSTDYQNVLQAHLLPILQQSNGQGLVFQQDNASIHVSASTKAWLQNAQVACLDWPACSPDLNPIENMWSILVRRVYAGNRVFNTLAELKNEIIKEWRNIPQTVRQNLVNSMNSRIFDLISKKGRQTKY